MQSEEAFYAMHMPTATRNAAAMAISARPSITSHPAVRTKVLPLEEEPEDWPPFLLDVLVQGLQT